MKTLYEVLIKQNIKYPILNNVDKVKLGNKIEYKDNQIKPCYFRGVDVVMNKYDFDKILIFISNIINDLNITKHEFQITFNIGKHIPIIRVYDNNDGSKEVFLWCTQDYIWYFYDDENMNLKCKTVVDLCNKSFSYEDNIDKLKTII